MFKDQRSFTALLFISAFSLFGYSVVFPVFAPLLIEAPTGFFAPDTPMMVRTVVLGLLFAVYGVSQYLCGLWLEKVEGRRKALLISSANAVVAFVCLGIGVQIQSWTLLFIGRIWTGAAAGGLRVAQSAAGDLAAPEQKGKAFGILSAAGALGFIIGPWIGGKLADPNWFFDSLPFYVSAGLALVGLILLALFFRDVPQAKSTSSLKMRIGPLLITFFLFTLGWGFFLFFSPTYFVQRFDLHPGLIGDFFAYMCIWWALSLFMLRGRILFLWGCGLACVGMIVFLLPDRLWPLLIILPFLVGGAAIAWSSIAGRIATRTPAAELEGVFRTSSSVWALSQVLAPLIAGPLAGWNLYLPISVGAFFVFCAFVNSLRRL